MRHRFSLVLERRDVAGHRDAARRGERLEAPAVAGVALAERAGVTVADCRRSAATLADAVLQAIRDLERAYPGWRVVRVEPDELVSAAAIARRLGRTRQSVAQLIGGRRGPGGFPHPAVWVDRAAPLWRWSDVASWCATAVAEIPQVERFAAEFLAMLNGELQARRHRERLAALSVPGVAPGSERFAVEVAFPQLGGGRRWRGAAAELDSAAPGRGLAEGI